MAYRAPAWEDYVALAFTEIRLCGAACPQVTRRMRASLDGLAALLPPERGEALRRESALLEGAVARSFPDGEERLRASSPDLQGFGSPAR